MPETHRRTLEGPTDAPMVQFGGVFNIPASNGVVHQVSGVIIPAFSDEVSKSSDSEELSGETYAWIVLGSTAGVVVGGMAFYKRYQMKKSVMYETIP